MAPLFPKQIAFQAVFIYLLSLGVVSVVFFDYTMRFVYYALGVVFVIGYFSLSSILSKEWKIIPNTVFLSYLTGLAFILRIIWVIVSYFFYLSATGIPFEFETADAFGYHNEAEWLANEDWSVAWSYYFGPFSNGISDVGYPLYLTVLYKIFGPIVIIPRIIKVFLSTITCILIYKLSSRTFGEKTGRIAGIMSALMPNLIIYCGYHLKETEMLFLEVAFLERLDYLIRNKKYNIITIIIPSVLAGSLFFFRTVLGAASIFAFASSIILSSTPSMRGGMKRAVLVGWGVLSLVVLSGGSAMTEVEALWEEKDINVEKKRTEQTSLGNQWAHYATGTIMAPLSFVLPFATIVDVDQQYEQQIKHSGNYIRNFMGFFALLAIFEAIRRKKWREFSLIGSFVIAYLGAVSLSGFSNSERFLLPGLPCLIMMWSYGISTLRKESYRFLPLWCIVVFFMEFGWAYFKLGSRGLF